MAHPCSIDNENNSVTLHQSQIYLNTILVKNPSTKTELYSCTRYNKHYCATNRENKYMRFLDNLERS